MSGTASSPQHAAAQQPPARLSSAQLRELSRQWRQREDEDQDKVRRVADVLDWLANHRENTASAPLGPPSRPQRTAPALDHLLALWRAGMSRLHLVR